MSQVDDVGPTAAAAEEEEEEEEVKAAEEVGTSAKSGLEGLEVTAGFVAAEESVASEVSVDKGTTTSRERLGAELRAWRLRRSVMTAGSVTLRNTLGQCFVAKN